MAPLLRSSAASGSTHRASAQQVVATARQQKRCMNRTERLARFESLWICRSEPAMLRIGGSEATVAGRGAQEHLHLHSLLQWVPSGGPHLCHISARQIQLLALAVELPYCGLGDLCGLECHPGVHRFKPQAPAAPPARAPAGRQLSPQRRLQFCRGVCLCVFACGNEFRFDLGFCFPRRSCPGRVPRRTGAGVEGDAGHADRI